MAHLKRVTPIDWRMVATRVISQGYLDSLDEESEARASKANKNAQPTTHSRVEMGKCGMDFVMGLLVASNKYDSIWIIVEKLTKMAYFIPVRANYFVNKLVQVYVVEMIKLHRALVAIVSDRGPKFTSRFWCRLQNELSARLDFSMAFHP
ncbi:uncharacterized protein LOC131176516 [Hevea brasiliensis]|uniref:uncharacterized protein LOC131176516 n=1 Tax=Hevea brasiliensis TaxID=3981 RepID=UPI0025F7217D|nr:uncharacterized protein LOC131176516 [Hevea brasiliensis]